MRQCRVIIRRLGGLQKRGQIVQTDVWGISLHVVAWKQLPSIGLLAECALFVEPLSTGRQGRLWNIAGLNLLVSEVCFLFRMESSGALILPFSLESQLDWSCPSRDQSTPAGKVLSLATICVSFLLRTVLPKTTSIQYPFNFKARRRDSSVELNLS